MDFACTTVINGWNVRLRFKEGEALTLDTWVWRSPEERTWSVVYSGETVRWHIDLESKTIRQLLESPAPLVDQVALTISGNLGWSEPYSPEEVLAEYRKAARYLGA